MQFDALQSEQEQHLSDTDYLELRYVATPVTLVDRPETIHTLYSLPLRDTARIVDRVFIFNDTSFPKAVELGGKMYTIDNITINDVDTINYTSNSIPSFQAILSINDSNMIFTVIEREMYSNDKYSNHTPCDDYTCKSSGQINIERAAELKLTELEQANGYIGLNRWKEVLLRRYALSHREYY